MVDCNAPFAERIRAYDENKLKVYKHNLTQNPKTETRKDLVKKIAELETKLGHS